MSFINRDLTVFVKKNSTFPEVKYPLTQSIMEKYDITDKMMQNVAITFSMINADTGNFRIANVEGKLIVVQENDIQKLDECKYTLAYRFKLKDTKKSGRFGGEFKLTFLGDFCSTITLPSDRLIDIIIGDSITKVDLI